MFSSWEKIDVPPHTFIGGRGTYCCCVGEFTVIFKVIGTQLTYFLVDVTVLCHNIEPKTPQTTTPDHKENSSRLMLCVWKTFLHVTYTACYFSIAGPIQKSLNWGGDRER